MKPKVTHYRLKIYPEGINDDEIDRAMQWVVEYLRWCEVEADKEDFPMSMNDYARLADDTIDTCIRYLEKVERELDRDNERP